MVVKLVLSVTIICFSILAGWLKSRPFESRVEHLNSLITVFGILEAEMRYRMDPLMESFEKISCISEGYAQKLFADLSATLKGKNIEDFSQCWNKAIENTYDTSSLSEKDLQILREVGLDMGKTDISGQNAMFLRLNLRLKGQVTEAIEEKNTKGKMYKSLGVSCGFLIIIIIL